MIVSNLERQFKKFRLYFQSLPIQDEYAPPLTMRLFDSRKFGVLVFAGIYITNITKFKFHPITAQEREIGLAKQTRSSFGLEFQRGTYQ